MAKRKTQPSETVQISDLKPGLAKPIAVFESTGNPVCITAANGEVLALFLPREKFKGDLTRAFPITADKFRKRRTRVAHGAFFGQVFLIRQREGDEYVLVPPSEYKDEINPVAIEEQTRRAVFGQFSSAPDDLASIRAAIGKISGKLDALLEALTQKAFAKAHLRGKSDLSLVLAKELGRLEERLRQLEAKAAGSGGRADSKFQGGGGTE